MPWRHNDLSHLAGAEGSPATTLAINGYATPWNEQQHVNYFDAQGHVHELVFAAGVWGHNDLFTLAKDFEGASPRLPANPNAIAGYASSWNEQQHIKYIDTGGRINELYYDGSWHHTDFIDLFNPGSDKTFLGWPAAQGMIAAYPTPGQQHIFYVGQLSHVHELYWDSHWHSNDLGTQIPSLTIGSPVGMHGYTTSWNQQQHIAVIDAFGSIFELYYADRWGGNHLAAGPSGSNLVHNSAIHGHVTTWNEQEHIIFIDTSDHINELYYLNGARSWGRNDLTALATKSNGGVPVGVAGSPTVRLSAPSTDTLRPGTSSNTSTMLTHWASSMSSITMAMLGVTIILPCLLPEPKTPNLFRARSRSPATPRSGTSSNTSCI